MHRVQAGQLRTAELGLYYYVARFYDPYLAHFVQADRLVPDPGKAVSYDRYAYVDFSPLRYTDPSGHRACDDIDESGKCITWTASRVLSEFGITSEGLSSSERWTVAGSAIYSGMTLANAISSPDPISTFKGAMGDIFIDVGKGKGPRNEEGKLIGNCNADTGVISCEIAPNIGNITHEFFHIFDKHYKDIANDDGHLASDYLPMNYREEPYLSISYKCDRYECISHPPSTKGFDWREAFANMGENWILETANVDSAHYGFQRKYGDALRIWMNGNIPVLLSRIGVK